MRVPAKGNVYSAFVCAYALNEKLNELYLKTRTGALARMNRINVKVEYFEVCTDKNHDACGRMGLYHTLTGVVRRVDPTGRFVMIGDRCIPFDAIGTLTII